jgi:hypothetical protein
MVSVTPRAPFTPEERTPWTDRRLGGPQSRSGHRGKTKNPLCFRRGSNPDRLVVQSVVRHWSTPYSKSTTSIFRTVDRLFWLRLFLTPLNPSLRECYLEGGLPLNSPFVTVLALRNICSWYRVTNTPVHLMQYLAKNSHTCVQGLWILN